MLAPRRGTGLGRGLQALTIVFIVFDEAAYSCSATQLDGGPPGFGRSPE
jgi:hypothetical protein